MGTIRRWFGRGQKGLRRIPSFTVLLVLAAVATLLDWAERSAWLRRGIRSVLGIAPPVQVFSQFLWMITVFSVLVLLWTMNRRIELLGRSRAQEAHDPLLASALGLFISRGETLLSETRALPPQSVAALAQMHAVTIWEGEVSGWLEETRPATVNFFMADFGDWPDSHLRETIIRRIDRRLERLRSLARPNASG